MNRQDMKRKNGELVKRGTEHGFRSPCFVFRVTCSD